MIALANAMLVRWGENMLSGRLGQYWLLVVGFLFILTVVVAPGGFYRRALDLNTKG